MPLSPSLTLYDCLQAPSAFRIRMFIAEKGRGIAVENVDLMAGEHLQAEYLGINPRGLVPALSIPGEPTVLTENEALAIYLEALWPEPPLLGSDPLEKARIAEWNMRIVLEGLLPLSAWFRNASPLFEGRALPGPDSYQQIPELVARSRQQLGSFMPALARRLKDLEFISGDRFGWADITAITLLDMCETVGLGALAEDTTLMAWSRGIRERPAYISAKGV